MHFLEDLGQLFHLLDAEMRLDNAPGSKIHRLNRFLARSYRRADNLECFADQEAGTRALDGNRVALGDTYTDDAAAEAEEGSGLGIGGVVGCADDDGMGAQSVCELVDCFDHVFCSVNGDEVLGARLECNLLLARVVDANHPVADASCGELACKMT